MGALYALASAVCYGIADFAGGLLSRRGEPVSVAWTGQAGGLGLTLVAALLLPSSCPNWADLAWGGLSGVGTGVGMVFLYRGLSHGAMSVVVPVSAVAGVALPVIAGVLVLGENLDPVSWVGVGLAIPALWLVTQTDTAPGAHGAGGATDGAIAGVGIALQYLALAQADLASGIWPVVAGRVAAVATISPLALRTQPPWRLRPRLLALAAPVGGTAALALVFYQLAVGHQLLSVAVVLSSLYPAIPILLGVVALHEHVSRKQLVGILAAGGTIAALTAA